jgi:hypothetical protein
MPDDKKERSTYTTAQFIDAYSKFIDKLGGEEEATRIRNAKAHGKPVENANYKRSVFNAIFIEIHNDDMRERFPHGSANKMIEEGYIDNTKISQIFNYVKTQLVKEGYEKKDIMPLPSASKGGRSRDWSEVGSMFGLKK